MSAGRALPPELAELCHQLSQPLTVARCSLELAQGMAADHPGRGELIEDARQAVERMVAIAAAIRDWRSE